jgi:hypothetical protein
MGADHLNAGECSQRNLLSAEYDMTGEHIEKFVPSLREGQSLLPL